MSSDLTKITQPRLDMSDILSSVEIQKNIDLKIDWLKHVVFSLEKLSDKHALLKDNLHGIDTSLTEDIAAIKEYVNFELKELRKDFGECKFNAHQVLDTMKVNLYKKISYERERMEDKLFKSLLNKIENVNAKVDKLNIIVTTVKVKITIIGAAGGIFGSVLLFLFQLMTKKYF